MSLAPPSRAALLVGALLTAAACTPTLGATYFENVPASQPGAQVRLVKGYQGTNIAVTANQRYSLGVSEYCEDLRPTDRMTWTTGGERIVRVAADQPLYVWAAATFTYPRGIRSIGTGVEMKYGAQICNSGARFTPRLDGDYVVRQVARLDVGCATEVLDAATGEVVSDARNTPAPVCTFVRPVGG